MVVLLQPPKWTKTGRSSGVIQIDHCNHINVWKQKNKAEMWLKKKARDTRQKGRPTIIKVGEGLSSSWLASKIKEIVSQRMGVDSESECEPWSMANKEIRTQSYPNVELNPANKLNEPGSEFFPRAPDKSPAWLT